MKTIGLLGTRFTMEDDFYKGRLTERHSLRVIIPSQAERHTVHRVIYEELCLGQVEESSKERYLAIMNNLVRSGAEGIILGCTEIGLLVSEDDSPVPAFDTTRIHAVAAANHALKQ